MINGVNSLPLYPIFFDNQVSIPKTFPEDIEEKESPPDTLSDFGPKKAEEVTKSLIDAVKAIKEEEKEETEKTKEETVAEEKVEKEEKEPMPTVMEIIEDKLKAEKGREPMAYSVGALKKAMEIPQESIEILLRKLGLYKKVDLLA